MKRDPFSVLLVEDDPDALLLFKRSLQESSRFPSRVDCARTIDEALEKLKKYSYHLLLVESKLRDEEGLALLEAMKAAHIERPFVLMTPIRDDRLVREAMRSGVSDVIVKSESHFHQLAERLRISYRKYHEQKSTASGAEVSDIEEGMHDFIATVDNVKAETLAQNVSDPMIKDELTGVFTHSYMHQRIVTEFSRASRYGYPLSCLMIDVDRFKTVNEQKGYQIGDSLLRECAQIIFDNCRLSDIVARYGGTQFMTLLPLISYEGALQLGKRLRTTFADHKFLTKEGEIRVTVSIGISSFPEDSMSCRSDLISHAHRALLTAKASGRNRCMLFRDTEPFEVPSMPKLEIKEDDITTFQKRVAEVADNARRGYLEISRDLLHALEAKDPHTAGHGANCAKYAAQVAHAMGLSIEEAEIIEHGILLHDIGKICIPDGILLKKGKLTNQEYELMKQHTYYGYKVLRPIKFLREEALIVLHHHEWFNGEGYPCRLKGDEIPLGARICAVIDAYDTMRQAGGRYRKTTTVKEAVDDLISFSGTQFDSEVVKVFIEILYDRKELDVRTYDRELLRKCIQAAVHKNSLSQHKHAA